MLIMFIFKRTVRLVFVLWRVPIAFRKSLINCWSDIYYYFLRGMIGKYILGNHIFLIIVRV